MATLKDTRGKLIELSPHHLLGRSRSMTTTLPSRELSAQHAAISWTGEGWVLQDLASRNGTFLGEHRLASGEQRALTPGAIISLGSHHHRFFVVELSPPSPRARSGEALIVGEPGFLALPSIDEPLVVIHLDEGQGWLLSEGDVTRPVSSDETTDVGGKRWALELPLPLPKTVEASIDPPSAAPFALSFRVSADEEYVELDVIVGHHHHALGARAHFYLLLTLARARLVDMEDDDLAESERGWLYTADLVRMLGISRNQLYVSMHRARKALGALEGLNPERVLETRSTTRQVRIGTPVLQTSPL